MATWSNPENGTPASCTHWLTATARFKDVALEPRTHSTPAFPPGAFPQHGIRSHLPQRLTSPPGRPPREMAHKALMRERRSYVIFADKHNWSTPGWRAPPLTEYSHMSASRGLIGCIASSDRYIHLSSGINSLSPRKETPGALRRALRHARPLQPHRPHTSGAPAAAPAPRAQHFNIPRPPTTKSDGKSHQGSPSDVGAEDYSYEASTSPCPRRNNLLPKRTARVTRRSGWRAATRPPARAF